MARRCVALCVPAVVVAYYRRLVPADPSNDQALAQTLRGFIKDDPTDSAAAAAGGRGEGRALETPPLPPHPSSSSFQSATDALDAAEARRVAALLRTVQRTEYTVAKSGKELYLIT